MTDSRRPPRILALGDSYTVGEGVDEGDRWPAQLARALRADGIAVADPELIAQTGWTADELADAIVARSPNGPFALVTLAVGVNDQYRGRPAEEYAANFRAVLARAIALAGADAARTIVNSIPDWGVTPFNRGRGAEEVAREIDAYNAVARAEVHRAGAHWVDVTDLSRAAPRDVAHDGLHPSAAMYERWTARILPVARAVLRS